VWTGQMVARGLLMSLPSPGQMAEEDFVLAITPSILGSEIVLDEWQHSL